MSASSVAIGKATLYHGDCRDVLRTLPDELVHTCITSPPYFGLRDYGVDGQIGLEQTPDAFVAELVAVFREVRRVLRDDGTLWLNLGDSYANNGGAGWQGKNGQRANRRFTAPNYHRDKPRAAAAAGLKPKDLIGIPWRVAFALQADGWYLRQDIIWAKPNPMPESVTDRCTKAHEYLFLLSKSPRYYWDQAAMQEPVTDSTIARVSQPNLPNQAGSNRVPGKTNGPMKAVYRRSNGPTENDSPAVHGGEPLLLRGEPAGVPAGVSRSGNKARKPASARGVPVDDGGRTSGAVAASVPWEGATRNKRSVWTVPTMPFSGAHFATFPARLIEPCVLAGCPPGAVVLDPFMGSGTTGAVAVSNDRRFVGIELNREYMAALATPRIRDAQAQMRLLA